jgi:hypothetical protein
MTTWYDIPLGISLTGYKIPLHDSVSGISALVDWMTRAKGLLCLLLIKADSVI